MASKTADAIKLVLRLPKSLHRRLKQQANRNHVSLNTEIVNQLEGYEAATIKRMTDIIQPLLDEAVKASVSVGSKVAAKSVLEVLRDAATPRTDREFDERLRQLEELMAHITNKEASEQK